jgi:NADH-quinone oxidoreductase subunit F
VRFFRHESCGKCTPCREGTFWALRVYDKIVSGNGTLQDIDMLVDVANGMANKCFCLLGEFATSPVLSTIKHFRPDYEQFVREHQDGRANGYQDELIRDHAIQVHAEVAGADGH